MAAEPEAGAVSSASESLLVSSESRRCVLAGRPDGEGHAASGFIGEV